MGVHLREGRIVRAERLADDGAPYIIWHNAEGSPLLSAHGATYAYGLYGDDSMLSRIVFLDDRLTVRRMVVFENAPAYAGGHAYKCDANGRITSAEIDSTTPAPKVNLEGIATSVNAKSRRAKISEPERLGLASYYTLPDEE